MSHRTNVVSQMVAILAALMVVLSVAPPAEADKVRYCIRGCGRCVEIFGKELYDGRRCAMTCHLTEGQSIDDGCGNELYHLIKRGGKMHVEVCAKYCGMCVVRWSKQVYDGLRCLKSCHLSSGASVDPACEDPRYSRLNNILNGLDRRAVEEPYN